MEPNTDFTLLSQKEWDSIAGLEMTPSEVSAYFYENISVRKFGDILQYFAEGQDVKTLLADRLCEYDPAAACDSIRKKVSNWLNGKNRPDDRGELIKLCFALSLDENQARRFMTFCSDGDFHLRNPQEVAFLYCLRSGKPYQEAVRFVHALQPPDTAETMPPETDTMVYTKVVADAFSHVRDDNSFHRFYDENRRNFGCLRNTAYARFMRFFEILTDPGAPLYAERDKAYSIETAVDTYLRMNLPLNRKTSKYTAIQKALRHFWPNVTIIKDMRSRKEDVNRKVLLLLYVVTEGIDSSTPDDEPWLEDMTPTELLEEHAWRFNLMLDDCGMSRLDPRNPFDWLILYSLKVNDDDGMSGRLQAVLAELFP